MTTPRQLHSQAMQYASDASVEKSLGNAELADTLLSKALESEIAAAEMLANTIASEPTRSILYKSAASMAVDLLRYDEARELVLEGLAGNPDSMHKVALDQILDTVQGLVTATDKSTVQLFTLHIDGPGIGSGRIPISELVSRLTAIQHMVARTYEFILEKPFRTKGKPPTNVRAISPVVRSFAAGSFNVHFSIENPVQAKLFDDHGLIGSVIAGLELVSEGRFEDAESLVGPNSYLINFTQNAKILAPDGEQITQVQVYSEGTSANLQIPKREMPRFKPTGEDPQSEYEDLRLLGEMSRADLDVKQITLSTVDGHHYPINVDAGLQEIVKQNFGDPVELFVRRRGSTYDLVDLQSNTEGEQSDSSSQARLFEL